VPDWLRDFYPEGIYCKVCKATTTTLHKSRMSYSLPWPPRASDGTPSFRTPDAAAPWFHAVFLMASGGISAKQLQREIGVTHKTAWRMFRLIRSLLNRHGKAGGSRRTHSVGDRKEKAVALARIPHPVVGIVQRGGKSLHS
jgi:hypothetical protein